jgi:integrase
MPAQITKRLGKGGKASWAVQLLIGHQADGKPAWLCKTFPTRAGAKAFVQGTLEDLRGGKLVTPSTLSLDAYLDHWLETAAKPALRPNTFASYRESLALYIRPELGRFQLDKLTPLLLQHHLESLGKRKVRVQRRKKAKGKGAPSAPAPPRTIAPRTIRYAFSVLAAALRQAVRWRILPLNPLEAVTLPRVPRREMRALDTEAARAFLIAAKGSRHEALFKLALATGMRPSEYLGLQWQDVDLKKGAVSVQRALIGSGGHWQLAETKTPRSRRTIPIPESVAEALRRHKAAQKEERFSRGPAWKDHGLVFTNEIGGPLARQNVLRRHFRPLLRKAGLPDTYTLYQLRHTAATLLLSAGVHPKVASERLGHASITMTLDTYSHVLPTMQQEASDKVEELLFGDGK